MNKAVGRHDLSLSTQYFIEDQQSQYLVNQVATQGTGQIQNWMINPVWKWRLNTRLHSTLRGYYTHYDATANFYLKISLLNSSSDDFHQSLPDLEWNPKFIISEHQTIFEAGAGAVNEEVNTIRYGSNAPRYQYTRYAFV